MRKVVVLLALLASPALAERPSEGLVIGLGLPMIGGGWCEFQGVVISQELHERRWVANLWTHGTGRCGDVRMRANLGVGIVRTTQLGRWSLGFGAGVQEHGDAAIGPDLPPGETADRIQLSAQILIRRQIGDRLVVDLWHASSGGSTVVNAARDTISVGWRF